MSTLKKYKEKLNLLHVDLSGFENLVSKYLNKKDIDWNLVKPLEKDKLISLDEIEDVKCNVKDLLSKLVILKLNGGLGTTMGCKGPKSLIEVKDGFNFLDLTIQQVSNLNKKYNSEVPLILMNSFSTEKDTADILDHYNEYKVKIKTFTQHKYPRMYKDTLSPVPKDNSNNNEWYPPGHGDLFESLIESGIYEELLREGKEIIFISNIDNLGATVDINILNYFLNSKLEYLMEVTKRTRADVKGGTLISYNNNIKLLERTQVQAENMKDFESITKFPIFNTNNIWISINSISKNRSKIQEIDIIVNPKTYDNKVVLQFEIAIGSAISFFESKCIQVSRKRFLPVKSTNDLFLIKSNLYQIEYGNLIYNGNVNIPLIKLGHQFKSVSDFFLRFPVIPNIQELERLTISGDVYFSGNSILKGDVIIIATESNLIRLPEGIILENKIVSGNLFLLDH